MRSGASPNIELMNLDGSNRTTLVPGASGSGGLALDAKRLHFTTDSTGIWLIGTNGSSPVEVVGGITSTGRASASTR